MKNRKTHMNWSLEAAYDLGCFSNDEIGSSMWDGCFCQQEPNYFNPWTPKMWFLFSPLDATHFLTRMLWKFGDRSRSQLLPIKCEFSHDLFVGQCKDIVLISYILNISGSSRVKSEHFSTLRPDYNYPLYVSRQVFSGSSSYF